MSPPIVANDPFASPPEPPRSMPDALLAAYHRAQADWCEYLPHGLSEAAYHNPPPPAWLLAMATHSAAAPLKPHLPLDLVTTLATTLAHAALHDTARVLAANEPD